MAERHEDLEPIILHEQPTFPIALNTYDVIDLTENDELISCSSVSTAENCRIHLPEKCDEQANSTENDSQICSGSMDESLSIIYENIRPPLEVQVVDQDSDILVKVVKGPGSFHGFASQNVTIGTKTLSFSVQINSEVNEVSALNLVKRVSTEKEFKKEVEEVLPSCAKKPKATNIECGICLDGADEISGSKRKLIATVCGHIFCSECLDKSLKIIRQCPKCRKKLTMKQFHPLYL